MASYGLLAEFASAEQLLDAVRRTRAAGYRRIEAYAPFPVQGLVEALGPHRDPIPLITLIGGLLGGAGGYFMQWYSAVISLPVNVGGRPAHSWPSFIPVTFELALLGAALFAVCGMLVLNGLPKLYHPLFNSDAFELASRNRFYLCVRCTDRKYDAHKVERHLESLDPLRVEEVSE
jgi:ActD protein